MYLNYPGITLQSTGPLVTDRSGGLVVRASASCRGFDPRRDRSKTLKLVVLSFPPSALRVIGTALQVASVKIMD